MRRNLLGQVLDVLNHVLVCSVVDQDVDCSHLLKSGIDDLLAVLLFLEVDGNEMALATILLDLLLRLLSVLLFNVQVGNQAVCSFHGEQDSNGTADARITTSDDGLFALELAGSLVYLIAAIFSGEVLILRSWA